MQGTHPQILPWTDDVSASRTSSSARTRTTDGCPEARRELRPSPRLGLQPDEYDEGEILAGLVGGLGGAFLGEERAIVEELRVGAAQPGHDAARRRTRTGACELLAARGLDVSGSHSI